MLAEGTVSYSARVQLRATCGQCEGVTHGRCEGARWREGVTWLAEAGVMLTAAHYCSVEGKSKLVKPPPIPVIPVTQVRVFDG